MALLLDVTDSLAALQLAVSDLELQIMGNYAKGRRVSVVIGGGESDEPVRTVTGDIVSVTIAYAFAYSPGTVNAFLTVHLDAEFCPCDSCHADPSGKTIMVNMLNPQYDVTLIS